MFQLKNKKAVNKALQDYGAKVEKALLYNLQYLVIQLENHAKESAGYQDRTGNLKSSIGGVVLKNGRPVSYVGFTNTGKGSSTGKTYLDQISQKYTSGYVLIIVAGMEYATYVENLHGLNVLQKSKLRMERELPLLLERLKQTI